MLTTSDRQPFCCQNTFYKQFISVYKFKFKQKQDLKTYPGVSHNPVPRPPSEVRGRRTGPIATLGH